MKNLVLTLVLILVLVAVMFGGLSVAGGYLSDEDTIWNAQREVDDGDRNVIVADLNLTPGVFVGTGGGGFYGEVSVELTVDGAGIITGIEVIYSNETPGFSGPAFAYLTDSIIQAQHGHVDAFAGATFSSTAFLNAARDAINQSSGEAPDVVDEPEPVLPEGTVFVGRGDGHSGEIVAEVMIDDEGRIVHIEVVEHSDTLGFALPAFEYLTSAVLEAQSADVDALASATYSSTGFLNAVQDALDMAGFAE
jgi:fumarate reductase flavoprotein subunit